MRGVTAFACTSIVVLSRPERGRPANPVSAHSPTRRWDRGDDRREPLAHGVPVHVRANSATNHGLGHSANSRSAALRGRRGYFSEGTRPAAHDSLIHAFSTLTTRDIQ
jgi:hypothetical protein